MYADREEADTKRSIKERLNGSSLGVSSRRPAITGKRQRQDDKWEHDLYQNDEPQGSNRNIGARDLRLKLQKKSLLEASQSGKGPTSVVRDLREKLSGTMNVEPVNTYLPKPKLEAAKITRKNSAVEGPAPEIKKVASHAPRKKAPQKNDVPVDDFLKSLGLEKYSITFQAEEVDMTALIHMGDEDLKAIGIPMGPRKKILLALESKV